jgi:hypothetical protein
MFTIYDELFRTQGFKALRSTIMESFHTTEFDSPEKLYLDLAERTRQIAPIQRKEAYGGEPEFQFQYYLSNDDDLYYSTVRGNSLAVFCLLLNFFRAYFDSNARAKRELERLETRLFENLDDEHSLNEFDTQICYQILSQDGHSYDIAVFQNVNGNIEETFTGNTSWTLSVGVQLS